LHIKVYVPTHCKQYITKIANELTAIFGGCTVYNQCKGFWKNESNKTEIDNITVIEVYTTVFDIKFMDILQMIQKDLKQSCIAYTVDNQMKLFNWRFESGDTK